MTNQICPCASELEQKEYTSCCEPLHLGIRLSKNALELMKSRYSAFVCHQVDYLLKTTHPKSRSPQDQNLIEQTIKNLKFVKLEILEFQEANKTASVEFKAYFREIMNLDQNLQVHHERSLFRKIESDGAWYYVEAKTPHHD